MLDSTGTLSHMWDIHTAYNIVSAHKQLESTVPADSCVNSPHRSHYRLKLQ